MQAGLHANGAANGAIHESEISDAVRGIGRGIVGVTNCDLWVIRWCVDPSALAPLNPVSVVDLGAKGAIHESEISDAVRGIVGGELRGRGIVGVTNCDLWVIRWWVDPSALAPLNPVSVVDLWVPPLILLFRSAAEFAKGARIVDDPNLRATPICEIPSVPFGESWMSPIEVPD